MPGRQALECSNVRPDPGILVGMTIEVRFFASLVDSTGAVRDRVELPDGSDVTVLWSALIERYPGLKSTGFLPLVACDMEYATWDANLDGVREVAFLPPVSGG